MDKQSKIVDAARISKMMGFLTNSKKDMESFKNDIEYLKCGINSLESEVKKLNGYIDDIMEELDTKEDKLELS